MELSHADIESLLGAYALGAVELDERDAVELHLRDCPRCRAEVTEHREAAAYLAHHGASAPAGVWDRIAAELEEAPPPLRLAAVTPIDTPAARRRRVRVPLAGVAIAAVLALVVASVALVNSVGSDSRDPIEQIVAGPESFRLTSANGRVFVAGALEANGRGYLIADNLPRLSRMRTYQLWAVLGDHTISVGILGPEPRVTAFTVSGAPTALAITEEVAGGVVSSEHDPVVVGSV